MKNITLDADKLFIIANAYTLKKVEDSREEIYIINPALNEKQQEALKAIQFELNEETGTFELDYSIMNDACNFVSELEHTDLANPEYDFLDNLDSDFASVYTATRLSYLNINNQDEISQEFKEYNCDDIATACAIWYDRQVERAIGLLIEWIRK